MQHVFCRRITDPSSPWSDLRQLAAFWQKSRCTISVCTCPNQPHPALFNVLTSSTYYLPIQSWQETPMEQCYIPPEWGLHVVNFCLEAKRGSFRSFLLLHRLSLRHLHELLRQLQGFEGWLSDGSLPLSGFVVLMTQTTRNKQNVNISFSGNISSTATKG